MLTDRIILMEKEIEKLTSECGKMYIRIVVSGENFLSTEYEQMLNTLTTLKTEAEVVKKMIRDGFK